MSPTTLTDFGPDGREPSAGVTDKANWVAGPNPYWNFDAASTEYYVYDGATKWGDFKNNDQWHFFVVLGALDGTSATQCFFCKAEANGTRKGIAWVYNDGITDFVTYLETGSVGNRMIVNYDADPASGVHLVEWAYDGSTDASGSTMQMDGTALTPTVGSDSLSNAITTANDAELGRRTETPSSGGPDDYFDSRLYLFVCYAVSGGTSPLGDAEADRFQRQLLRRFAP